MISKIGLGSVQFGLDYGISNSNGITPESEVRQIIEYASNVGIQTIDTAFGYGKSEEVLGKYHQNRFRIISKILPETCGYSFREQIQLTLNRLNTSSLYGLLVHRPGEFIERPELWQQLTGIKENGLISKIGFSFNKPEEIDQILDKKITPDLIQVPFSYFDNRFDQQIQFLKQKHCEIHVRSVFLQGLFLADIHYLDDFFEPVKETILTLQNINNLPSLLLRFVAQKTYIDNVIIGINTLAQLKENIAHINSPAELPPLNQKIPDNILIPSLWPQRKK